MLTLIAPSDLRKVWPIIKNGLTAVAAKNNVEWIPEDVFFAIKSGTAALHLSEDGSFMVTCLNRNDYTQAPELHVWIAYSAGVLNVLEEGLSLLRSMARNAGATKITFDSPRKGWEKRYKLITAVYEVPL